VADGFRQDGSLDVRETLTTMGVGEALVSTLQADGAPTPVRRTLISPPESRIGPLTAEERAALLDRSPLQGPLRHAPRPRIRLRDAGGPRPSGGEAREAARSSRSRERAAVKRQKQARRPSQRQGVGEAMLKSAARSVGSASARRLVRGILGSLLK
jgi:uncharacterized protein